MKVERNQNFEIEKMWEGRFLRVVKKGSWEYVERVNCSGVVIIVAMTEDRKVIFVEQYRPPVNCRVIEFPAGLVNDENPEENESPQQAGRRELLEETGYEAGEVTQLLQGPVSSGSTGLRVTMIQALDVKKVEEGGGVDLEDITVHVVGLDDVDQWLKSQEQKGFLIEPKIYAGLYFLKFHL